MGNRFLFLRSEAMKRETCPPVQGLRKSEKHADFIELFSFFLFRGFLRAFRSLDERRANCTEQHEDSEHDKNGKIRSETVEERTRTDRADTGSDTRHDCEYSEDGAEIFDAHTADGQQRIECERAAAGKTIETRKDNGDPKWSGEYQGQY